MTVKINGGPRNAAMGLVILCLLVAIPSAALAQGVALERQIPSGTILYVEVPNIAKAIEGLNRHPLAALMEEEEVKAFLEPVMTALAKNEEQMKEMLGGLDLAGVLDLFGGKLQLALVGVAESDMGPKPNFTAAVSVGDRTEDARKFVARLIEMARQNEERVDDVKLGEIPAWRFDGSGLLVFFAHQHLILDTDRARAERIVAGKEGPADSLPENAKYQAIAAKVKASTAHALYYFNMKGLLDLTMQTAPAGEQSQKRLEKVMVRLGLDHLSAMGSSMTFGPRGVTERVHIPLPAKRTGILKLFDTLKPGLTHPKRLGDNTVAYLGERVDLLAAYDLLVDVVGSTVRELDPDSSEEMDDFLQQAESGDWGFKLRDDLLASLGDEFGVSMGLPRMGAMIPDVLLTLSIRDRAKVTSLVDHMRSTLPPEKVTVSRVPVGDYTMLAFKIKNVPMSPAVAVLDDTLVAGLFAPSVRRYLRGYKKSLAGNATFQDGLQSVGLQDMSTTPVLFYVDVRRVLSYLYDNFGPLLATMDPSEFDAPIPGLEGLDFALLPTTEALTRGFKPWVVTARVDGDGFSTTAVGPAALNSLQLAFGLGAAMWVVPMRTPVAREGLMEEEVIEEEPEEEEIIVPGKPAAAPPSVSLGIEALDLDGGAGFRITAVDAGGAAAAAGLQVGDAIRSLNGQRVADVDAALAILAKMKPGQTVLLTVRRGKKEIMLPLVLKSRTPAPARPGPSKG